MRIDTHSHVLPRPYLELFKRNTLPTRATSDGSRWVISYGGIQEYRLSEETYDIAVKLKEMDRLGIDLSILSTNIPGPDLLEEDLALDGARIINDYLADTIGKHPDRFAGLMSLPWQYPEAALGELDRAADDLKLCGIILYSHIGGRPVDDPAFEPIYRRAAERQLPIVFHPTVPSWGEAIKEHDMIPMLGLQVDSSFALLRLILSGVLERYPSLQVVMPHAGGVLPYMMGRIDHQTEVLKRGREHIKHAPSTYLKRVFIDTVSPSAQTLRFAYEFSGAERLLFGTDHPWVDAEFLLRRVEGLGLPEDELTAILSFNAQSLFRM